MDRWTGEYIEMQVRILDVASTDFHLELILDGAQFVLHTAWHIWGNLKAEADVMSPSGESRVVHC